MKRGRLRRDCSRRDVPLHAPGEVHRNTEWRAFALREGPAEQRSAARVIWGDHRRLMGIRTTSKWKGWHLKRRSLRERLLLIGVAPCLISILLACGAYYVIETVHYSHDS